MREQIVSWQGVYVVWLRHLRVYSKTWIVNCLAPISEPAIYLVAFGLGMGPLIGEISLNTGTISYVSFLVPGMIAVGVLFQSFLEGAYCVYHRIHYQRTWTSMLASPLSYTDVYLGDLLWAATRGVIAGLFTGIVAIMMGMYDVTSFLYTLPTIVFAAILFGALGLCSTALAKRIDHINIPIYLVCVPMFVFCGTYFPRNTLPAPLPAICDWLPLSPIVDLLRNDFPATGFVGSIVVSSFWLILFVGLSWHGLRRKVYR